MSVSYKEGTYFERFKIYHALRFVFFMNLRNLASLNAELSVNDIDCILTRSFFEIAITTSDRLNKEVSTVSVIATSTL